MAKEKEPLKQSDIKLLHPLMGKIANAVIENLQKKGIDARVIETARTPERQQYLYDKGASKTLNSKHIKNEAFDIGIFDKEGKYVTDAESYLPVGNTLQELGVTNSIIWGGNWNMKDMGHIEGLNIKPIVSDFGKAFGEARKAGLKEFEYDGKKFTTELK